ncbi:VanZ family protein [bacterium]|nr:VanZ family protein [bacterium]
MKPSLLLAIGVGGLLVLLLVVPNFRVQEIQQILVWLPGIDKAVHYGEHVIIVLGGWWLLGFTRLRNAPRRRVATAFVASLLLALLDESQQRFISGRNFEIADLAANGLGALTGLALLVRRRIGMVAATGAVLVCVVLAGLLVADSYRRQQPYYQGRHYEQDGQYELAKEHYLRAVAAGNTSGGLYNDLAWLEVELLAGDPAVAHRYAALAVRQRPDNPAILDTYGWTLYRLGRLDEALSALSRARELDPTIFCIDYHLGAVHQALGNREKARMHFQKQAARSPDDRYGRLSRAALAQL